MVKQLECNTHSDWRHPFELHTVEDLMERYSITIRPATRRMWRLTFPNVGQLDGFPHFGNVMIVATDGLLAYYHTDESNTLFLGHLKAFNGPIAKEYVDEEDWDFERRCRKVHIFKRTDGTITVIPKDVFWDHYWSKHERIPLSQLDDNGEVRVKTKKPRKPSTRSALYKQFLESI